MARNGSRYSQAGTKIGDPAKNRPTFAELLGFGGIIAGQDKTSNYAYPPEKVPPRTKLPGRGAPEDSLDRFSPEAQGMEYDFAEEGDESSDAMPEIQSQQSIQMKTQGDPTKECPSTKNPNRFVHQGGSKS